MQSSRVIQRHGGCWKNKHLKKNNPKITVEVEKFLRIYHKMTHRNFCGCKKYSNSLLPALDYYKNWAKYDTESDRGQCWPWHGRKTYIAKSQTIIPSLALRG